ncbi:peptidoglycan DD-metalloendopeptidase family protein, partial [Cohnella sp. CFH 77786]|uniref:M23 family metallopeptidase n=1 Tax=Cohnella sp. CFH 77786 TaxID=2662265 RepID=UPI001C60DCDA
RTKQVDGVGTTTRSADLFLHSLPKLLFAKNVRFFRKFDATPHEISTIAHLKNGSVKVKAGDRVTAGELIGKCGNSGNSTEPHIHFQVSAPSDTVANMSTIPISFTDNIRPIRGDRIGGNTN